MASASTDLRCCRAGSATTLAMGLPRSSVDCLNLSRLASVNQLEPESLA
jgi:hypothetical protein